MASSRQAELTAGTVPLVALRADLDVGWPAGARWLTSGEAGQATLEQPVGAPVQFPLRSGERSVWVRGTIRIDAPRQRLGTTRLRIFSVAADGSETTAWRGAIRCLGGRRFPRELSFEANLATVDGALVLRAEGPPGTMVRWEGVELDIHTVTPSPAVAQTAPDGPAAADPDPHAGPLISVLTPVHDPPLEVLAEAVDSVLEQTFGEWELCLVDDGSRDPEVRELLAGYAAAEDRVRVQRREQAGGIAVATNAALEMARGRFVALLDHDDLLHPEALAEVASALARQPDTDMLYTDETVFGLDGAEVTFAKPHWSPDLLRSQMFTCHLGIYRRSLAREAGGFDPEFDGSQDYDLALRVSERTDRIVHIPRTLYRWRAHSGSSAGNTAAKPAAYTAARRAIAAHLERTGVNAEVHFGPWQGIYRVVHRPASDLSVALCVIAPNGSSAAHEPLDASVERGDAGLAATRVATFTEAAEAAEACGDADVIVICEGPVEPLTRFWLSRLVGFAQQPGVAAVGARVVAPDGRVEHGGLALAAGVPVPLMYGADAADPGPLGVGILPANCSAVSGVVALSGEELRRRGGLDPAHGSLAIADYCLRATAAGLRVVSAPDTILRRLGDSGPNTDLVELERFRARWSSAFAADPYFELSTCWPGVG